VKLCRGLRTFCRHSNSSPNIGLAQLHAALLGLPYQSRARARLISLRSVGNITAFGCTVGELHQRMVEVDAGRAASGTDPARPTAVAPSAASPIPPPDRLRRTESVCDSEKVRKQNSLKNWGCKPHKLANSNTAKSPFNLKAQWLACSSRSTSPPGQCDDSRHSRHI
jgi:hypothetical protein